MALGLLMELVVVYFFDYYNQAKLVDLSGLSD